MFKIESYVTPILLSYVDKYVKDFKPANAQVSLWGGGVALHNLVLKADVLQKEINLPFTLVSGRIHELLIQVPWTKIMSEPIVVTIDTIECILTHPSATLDENPPPESPSRKSQEVEAPPGYMQALVRRVVSNISLRIHHLIVKYVHDDIVLSLNIKHLTVDSAGNNWTPCCADIDQNDPVLRKLVRLDDLTLCLDRSDSDGKIRFYQEPLLYRCQLDFRVLTKLVSANSRRPSSVSAELRSSKLAWGITSDQVVLLLRLLRERNPSPIRTRNLISKTSQTSINPQNPTPENADEPTRKESWSEWASSWVPTMGGEDEAEEAAAPTLPTPIHFAAYFDEISLIFKIFDEDSSRKRARGILELEMANTSIRSDICKPTTLRVAVDVNSLVVLSHGRCVCGHANTNTLNDEPTIYLKKTVSEEDEFTWSENNFDYGTVEKAEIAEEFIPESVLIQTSKNVMSESNESKVKASDIDTETLETAGDDSNTTKDEEQDNKEEPRSMIRVEFTHERSPPTPQTNPYGNPPLDFEYSDWEEQCSLKLELQPLVIRVCMGLIHRVAEIQRIISEGPPNPVAELPIRVLTVEECDSLLDNLPQRRIYVEINDFRIRVFPWDHSLTENLSKVPIVLELELPSANATIASPLYPHRVCTAACQMPEDTGPIWQGSQLHISAALRDIQVNICDLSEAEKKPCARTDIRFVVHFLLNKQLFARRQSITFSYSVKIQELNVSGSAPRLQAVSQVLVSLINKRHSQTLKLTSLPEDALNDEDLVALDMSLEGLLIRGYLTSKTNTHIMTMQSARATFLHAQEGEDLKQAWFFSAPEIPSSSPYLRLAVQWCSEEFPSSLDYCGAWTEPTAICIDPLLIAWLAYRPYYKPANESGTTQTLRSMSSGSTTVLRRRTTPPSSSGRGASAEQVHVRARSAESSSEPSEKKESIKAPPKPEQRGHWWSTESMLVLHERLKHLLISSELGLVLVYVTQTTASAVDCVTVQLAMEQHALAHRVLVFSVGRWSLHTSTMTKHLWQDIRHDGPTFVGTKSMNEDAFPWKMRLADISCYILEAITTAPVASKEKHASKLRSQLKVTHAVSRRTVLELLTTTVTLSVVTKSIQYKTLVRDHDQNKYKSPTKDEVKMKYFRTGSDFKPTTLREFVRGPVRRKTAAPEQPSQKKQDHNSTHTVTTSGPMVSLGFHLHADTPPIIVRLDQDQIRVVGAALHCITHILTLIRRTPLVITRQPSSATNLGDRKPSTRSATEIDELRSPTESINEPNEIIAIFEDHQDDVKIHTFIWFQWVISRATLVVSTYQVKLAFEVDDIISTVDLQEHYNQLRIKIASASIKNYERSDTDEWVPGPFKGRVVEAREPANAQEDDHFFSVTITQAQISNLPASWKEELHPKMFDPKYNPDTIWEVYATLAPLEIVLLPAVLENIIYAVNDLAPKTHCPLRTEIQSKKPVFQWPFCYINAGGLRVVITCNDIEEDIDDTFVISIHNITVNPYPENPICRRPINTCAENLLNVGGGYEGRQYELLVKHVSIRTTQFTQLLDQELNEGNTFVVGENPARKWTQQVAPAVLTHILYPVDIGVVIAAPLFVGPTLAAGAGVELNFTSDCVVELGIHQIKLTLRTLADIKYACRNRDFVSGRAAALRRGCSYASIFAVKRIPETIDQFSLSDMTLVEENLRDQQCRNFEADSGLDTVTSQSTITMKKSVSVTFSEHAMDPSDYLEVFVTMGVIDVAVYVLSDTAETQGLNTENLSRTNRLSREATNPNKDAPESTKNKGADEDKLSGSSIRSLSEQLRQTDTGANRTDLVHAGCVEEGMISLIHVILYQPNIYYNKMKWQKNVQVSLFNMWMGIDAGENSKVIFTTARGVIDPVTEIPPALATMKYTSGSGSYIPSAGASARGSLTLDIERPILFQVSSEVLQRFQFANTVVKKKLMKCIKTTTTSTSSPLPYQIRRLMMNLSIESMTVQAGQIGVSGDRGTAGWDSASLQVAWSARPERLVARAFVSALMVAFGPPNDGRHLVLHPLQLGAEVDATWDAWRRVEGGLSDRDPITRVGIDLDRVVVDLRPEDLDVLKSIHEKLQIIMPKKPQSFDSGVPCFESPNVDFRRDVDPAKSSKMTINSSNESFSLEADDTDDHYYKDDLRSGAFKIASGGQVPMAYQVLLHKHVVTWQYPHPRAITRIVAFPLPDQETEVECVLEMLNKLLRQWEPIIYFSIPIDSPKEFIIHSTPPEAIFATTWRFRATTNIEKRPKFEFDMSRFVPTSEPMGAPQTDTPEPKRDPSVTAEQLSGVLRVDSYFSPRLLPLLQVSARVAAFELHAYNSLPYLSSQATVLEGYYVSKPLMRCHRMLSIVARDIAAYVQLGSPAGKLFLVDTVLSSEIFDCASGVMEQMIDEFRLQTGLSLANKSLGLSKVRMRASEARVVLHVPRIRTLQALLVDWKNALKQKEAGDSSEADSKSDETEKKMSKRELAEAAAVALEGRVSMWVHNSCAAALRIGQEGTDEVVPLGPGGRLAYRWRSPTAPKKLRFALANPAAEWRCPYSVPFTVGQTHVPLEESTDGKIISGEYVYVSVKQVGATRQMRLSGRLVLANMLRLTIVYKVRARNSNESNWQSIFSGELVAETVGRSVICNSNCDMALKLKFLNHNTGWSGDIPLKECPKENVPWLVKVPSEGELPYISVWCRVVRARFDGRILATIWPLYVLHSHIPLDTDVLLATETGLTVSDVKDEDLKPAPLIQTAPGRGCSTHLLAPGTTSAKHSLSFQYRNIECPVTREAVPLHYGVTDASVFDKRPPVQNIDEVIDEILLWLARSGKTATSAWPYSQVSNHWPGAWQPALMQPRCDVIVRYQAVRAGGGCSLEVQLCPVLLLCNASPICLTLRAHDAAPLCKLEPGNVISPPSTILNKPFFMSVEMGRDTFVSGQLEVADENPGQYGSPPPGKVAIGHVANFAIQCNQKATLLTLYYEIKEDINVLGITSTFVLFNQLKTDVLVSAIAISNDVEKDVMLRPKTFKVVSPTKEKNFQGAPLCRFWLYDRWRGGDACELFTYLCLALPTDTYPSENLVPVRLGLPPLRRVLALRDDNLSEPVVVTQHKYEGRWIVTVAKDPCPQFVIHNLTRESLCIAQPQVADDTATTSQVMAITECPGVYWWCTLSPDSATHYSSPEYCNRHLPILESPPKTLLLTFAHNFGAKGFDPEWCPPVPIVDGEQLVQVGRHFTVKLRVKLHPHSSSIELLDVAQTDIAASDIRKRLIGSFMSGNNAGNKENKLSVTHLTRMPADSKLPVPTQNLKKAVDAFIKVRDKVREEKAEGKVQTLSESDKQSQSDDYWEDAGFSAANEKGSSQKSRRTHAASPDVSPHEHLESGSDELSYHSPMQHRSVSIKFDKFKDDSSETTLKDLSKKDDSTVPTLPAQEQLIQLEFVETEPADGSTKKLTSAREGDEQYELKSREESVPLITHHRAASNVDDSTVFRKIADSDVCDMPDVVEERIRCVIEAVMVEFGAAEDTKPLLAVHADRATLLISAGMKRMSTTISVADVQVDNLQYDSGQYDFAVLATTRNKPLEADQWSTLWNMFSEDQAYNTRQDSSRVLVHICSDKWSVVSYHYNEITELDVRLGPLALYIEDAYVKALTELLKQAIPPSGSVESPLAEAKSVQKPLRLRILRIQPLDLTLTLHTAYRMYIALDHSPLHLNEFRLENLMTSRERLAHALTVHYLSAAILGAGWVVGGLELLGAPGALAARVGGATGGVRGVASAAAAALLRSLSALAGSLARNLDILAGDEEHARRAAAARRRPPDSFMAGLVAGMTNFAINILGAVGGLAHHPLVGVAVGESESGATALRRGILGAFTKPLSATADLVAYAGHGLLRQTGWDPVPQPRALRARGEEGAAGWHRDCVRWTFRLADLTPIAGYEVLMNDTPLLLLLTQKFIVIADPETERIVEMIDFRFCSVGPYQGPVIELRVTQRRNTKVTDSRVNEDDEFQISAAAMARVARYTGAASSTGINEGARVLSLLPRPGLSHALHAAITAITHHNSDSHFAIL